MFVVFLFVHSWEQRKLGELSSLITKGTTPLDKNNSGIVNFVKIESIDESSGDITITQRISIDEHNGYLRRSQLKENDILFSIAGTLGRVTSVKSSILPANTNQALAIIRLKDGCLDYVKTYLKGKAVAEFIKKNPTIGAQPNLSLEQVANLEIAIPSVSEQVKIGNYFEKLDNLITLHQREFFRLILAFFCCNSTSILPISWEQRKFEDAFIERREKTVTENEDTLLSCAINGMFLNSELFGHFRGTTTIGYLKVKKNDLILSAQNLHLGNANVNLRFEHGIISPAYKVYDLNNCKPEFVQAWVKKEDTKNFFLAATTEGASQCRKNIEWDTLGKQTICMPAIKEQATIGSFFKCVDNLITLHQRIKINITGDYHDKKDK